MPRTILNVSADNVLLTTRAEIFRRGAFFVVNAKNHAEVVQACFNHDFSAVVIGHTFSAYEKKQVVETIRMQCQSYAKIIGLYQVSESEVPDVDFSVSSSHPQFLVDVLRLCFPTAQEY